MAEQPINLSTNLYLGVFSRAEQRALQAILKAIADGGGRCVGTLAMLARESNTSKTTTRNAIARAVAIGLLEKTERRSYYAVSLPNILTYGNALTAPQLKQPVKPPLCRGELSCTPDRLNQERALRLGDHSAGARGSPRRRELRSHSL